jgi:multidrug resistance efflux pump
MTGPYKDDGVVSPQVTQKLLSPWFVAIMETIGYALCGLVGIGLLYSLVTQVDVLVSCEGSLTASTVAAVAPAESVVVDWLVEPGQKIKAGDPLCTLAVEPLSRDKARARHLLSAAWKDLDALTDAQSQTAAAQARSALDTLGFPQDLRTVNAQGSGIVAPTGPALRSEMLKPGEAVAHTVDASCLVMVGTVPPTESAKVAVGNPARVTAPHGGVVLEGRVLDVNKGAPNKVTLLFESIPESLQQSCLANFISPEAVPAETVLRKAEIVVGSSSLFRSLFGRR